MSKRADKGELVCVCRNAFERAANLNARKVGLNRSRDGAEFGGSVWLGIECLDLGWSARQPEPNDRGLLGGSPRTSYLLASPEETRKGKGAETQCTDAKKIAARWIRAARPSWDANMVSMAGGLLRVTDSEDASQVGQKTTTKAYQTNRLQSTQPMCPIRADGIRNRNVRADNSVINISR